MTVVFVCAECPDGAARAHAVAAALVGCECEVRPVTCMSGCASGGSVAVRAPGKTAYLFGSVGDEDLPGLALFMALYAASPDGALGDARPLGSLRFKALARIPAA